MKFLCAFVLVMTTALFGADALPGKSYKIDFTVKDMEAGKTITSRTYSMRAEIGQPEVGSIRTGSKVPVPTGGSSAITSMQFTYIEAGVNIDVHRFREADSAVFLVVSAEVSSFVETSSEKISQPIIRQNRWNSTVSAKIGKPTVIFSSDDVSSKRQMIIEMTATPIP